MTQQDFVAYYTMPQESGVGDIMAIQQQATKDYMDSIGYKAYKFIGSYKEMINNKKSYGWSELRAALNTSKKYNAKLVIAELGNLSNNEKFVDTLLGSGIEFYCCDQPFVTHDNLGILCKHAKIRKQQHGNRIMQGLKRTSKKSGNPHAAKTINEVNKPKINAAIAFALLLKPIIKDYLGKGFSQRRMVQALNNEGFTAPEGGTWVLSQLQKVLDRIRLNDIALSTKNLIQELKTSGSSEEDIAQELNSRSITAIKRSGWNAGQVRKLSERIQQIEDITMSNHFIMELLSMTNKYHSNNMTAEEIINNTDAAKLETTYKQVLAYQKTIKSHFGQVEMVMAKPNHNSISSEQLLKQLGTPIVQIRNIMNTIQDKDIDTIAKLSVLARQNARALEEEKVS